MELPLLVSVAYRSECHGGDGAAFHALLIGRGAGWSCTSVVGTAKTLLRSGTRPRKHVVSFGLRDLPTFNSRLVNVSGGRNLIYTDPSAGERKPECSMPRSMTSAGSSTRPDSPFAPDDPGQKHGVISLAQTVSRRNSPRRARPVPPDASCESQSILQTFIQEDIPVRRSPVSPDSHGCFLTFTVPRHVVGVATRGAPPTGWNLILQDTGRTCAKEVSVGNPVA